MKIKSLLAGVCLIAVLSACDGSDTSAVPPPEEQQKTAPTPPVEPVFPSTDDSRHVLLVTIDGLDAAQLQQAIAAGAMPSLSGLSITPAYAGGIVGTLMQQDLLSGPGLATIITGSWAYRNGVTSDAAAKARHAESVFARLKMADAGHQSAVIASSPLMAALLQDDENAGAIDRLVDCAEVDLCVADATSQIIREGEHDLVVANFHQLSVVANSGLYRDYQQALNALNQQLDRVLSAVNDRKQRDPLQEWLIIITSDRGMRAKGALPALPLANQTVFVAMNQPGNALFKLSAASSLYDYASQADVAPTILDFMGAKGQESDWEMDGQSLIALPAVQQLRFTVDSKSEGKDIALNWRLAAESAIPRAIRVYRNGALLATLPGAATSYRDLATGVGTEGEKKYTFNYVVSADYPGTTDDGIQSPTAILASVDYQTPNDRLGPTLLDKLMIFLPFDQGLVDIKGGAGFSRLNPEDTPISYTYDGFAGQALIIDPRINSYTMVAPLASLPQFTLGFWYNSDARQAWLPMVTNKDWDSGYNRGFIISQTSGANGVTLNFGDGSQRVDSSLYLPSNQWVYIALTVDVTAQQATAYLGQPGQTLQTSQLDLSSLNLAEVFANQTLVFSEDATGLFYPSGYAIGSVSPKYNDFAIWSRVLSANEVTMLFSSQQSLTSLNP